MSRLFQRHQLTFAIAALAAIGFSTSASAQTFPEIGATLNTEHGYITFDLTVPTGGGHALVAAYISAPGNDLDAMFARSVAEAPQGSIGIDPYSCGSGAWTGQIGGGITASAPVTTLEVPPSIAQGLVTEIEWSRMADFAKPFDPPISMPWPTSPWGVEGSSYAWGELDKIDPYTGNEFDSELVVRACLAKQTNTSRTSKEVNTLVELIRKGVTPFYMDVAVIEIQAGSNAGEPLIKVSRTKKVTIALTGEGNENWYWRYEDDFIQDTPFFYLSLPGEEFSLELKDAPDPNKTYRLLLPMDNATYDVVPCSPGLMPNSLTALMPAPLPIGPRYILGEAVVVDQFWIPQELLASLGGMATSFYHWPLY